MFLSLPAFKI